jgi:Terminase small subunit
MARTLTIKQLAFIAGIKAGKTGVDAAIAAGYSVKSARHAAYQLLETKLVRAEIDRVHEELRAKTMYDLETAMAECGEGLQLAYKTNNASAAQKFVELRSKLNGLLIIKQEISVDNRVDIASALADARARIAMRPRCDPVDMIEGEIVAAPRVGHERAPDYESVGGGFANPLDVNL